MQVRGEVGHTVTCANDDFPKAEYLQLILAFHVWGLSGPLEKENLGFLQRVVLGTNLYQQKWDWGTGSGVLYSSSNVPLFDLLETRMSFECRVGNLLPTHIGYLSHLVEYAEDV